MWLGTLTAALLCGRLLAELACGETKYSKTFSRLILGTDAQRIVGGVETKPNAWPWMVEILRGKSHQCGGALVDAEFVVTAAHCFLRGISPPARLNDTINRVCLPAALPPVHTVCVVTGWGRLEEEGPPARALREAHVPLVSPLTCNDARHYAGRIFQPTMICAGYADGKVDACQGDSGGPLVCWNKNAWELQGIVSWGIGCAEPGHPGVYTRVSALTSWVRLQMLLMKNSK